MRILELLSSNNGAYVKKLGEIMDEEEKIVEEKRSVVTKVPDENEMKEVESKNPHFENLSLLFMIFKSILNIADQSMIELFVSDEFQYTTFGALERKNLLLIILLIKMISSLKR